MPKKTKINSLNYLFTLGFTFIQLFALASLGNIGAFAAVNTANLIIGLEDKGTTVELSTCVQSTGSNTMNLADVSTWFDLANFTTTPTITEEGKFTAASGFYDPVFQQVSPVIGATPAIWSQRLTYTGNNTTGGLAISTTPELMMKNTLTKSGTNPTATLHVNPGAEWFTVPGPQITFTVSNVVGDCRAAGMAVKTMGTNPSGQLIGTVGDVVGGSIVTNNSTYNGPAKVVIGMGCTIVGDILNGTFTPTMGQVIPAGCPTGVMTTGSLEATTVTGVVPATGVASNFTPALAAKTLGTNPTGVLTGTIGQNVTGAITTTGSSYIGQAQYTNGTCVIDGNMLMNVFTPTANQVIPASCPTGALTSGSLIASGVMTLTGVASSFTPIVIVKTPLTLDDLKTTDLKCNDNKNVVKNTTTTCTFTLPNSKTLPMDLKLAIGDATPAGTCTLSGITVTCTNVPTGSLTGRQSIFSQLGMGAKVDTTKTAMVDNTTIALVNTGTTTTPVVAKPVVKTLSRTGANSIFLIAGSIVAALGVVVMIVLRKVVKK
ncbi:MAG: hypothetical protein H7230_00900 [Candidatus Parcubacteria bacterium]|nr:hypothetical protein [Candidatus Paceibacterota bacterium]